MVYVCDWQTVAHKVKTMTIESLLKMTCITPKVIREAAVAILRRKTAWVEGQWEWPALIVSQEKKSQKNVRDVGKFANIFARLFSVVQVANLEKSQEKLESKNSLSCVRSKSDKNGQWRCRRDIKVPRK